MNNIYAQKAKKYKYKYLKLKNEYNGEGGNYLGEGTYGCLISPPYRFTYGSIIHGNDNIDMYNDNHVGKFLKCFEMGDYNSFYDEYEELIKLNGIDPQAEHRSKIVFAAYIKSFGNNKVLLTDNNYQISKQDVNYPKLDNCLKRVKNKYISNNPQTNNPKTNGIFYNFGYIISTKVGSSFDKIKLNKFNINEIIQILTNLKESIQDLITTLYSKKLIHADIKFANMTLDEQDKFKICFIDFGLMKNLELNTDIKKLKDTSQYYLYPDILYTYFNKISQYSSITKSVLIRLLNSNKNVRFNLRIPGGSDIFNPSLLDKYSIDYRHFFKSLDDNTTYPLDQIYIQYIKPIIKNIDIYGLSLFIYELFNTTTQKYYSFNQNEYKTQQNTINIILDMLIINALYNNIDGPEELIYYLDGIINCLGNKYESGYIKNKIYERRTIKKIPYKMFYKEGYSEVWVEGIEEIISYKDNVQPQLLVKAFGQGQGQGQRLFRSAPVYPQDNWGKPIVEGYPQDNWGRPRAPVYPQDNWGNPRAQNNRW